VSEAFARYLNDVERFFWVVRKSGFLLSPRDTERVRQWYLRGIPLRVVLEGILGGMRAHARRASRHERPPHNLSFYSRFIGAQVRRFRHAPEDEEAPHSDEESSAALDHLLAECALLIHGEERTREREVKLELQASLTALREESARGTTRQSLHHQLQVLDDHILALYHSVLNEEELVAVNEEAGMLLVREQGLSPKARAGRRKVLVAQVLRTRLNMAPLVE